MIEKPTSIITSLGRTGTKFFAEMVGDIVPDVTSFHEPDVFHLAHVRGHTIWDLISQIKAVGFSNLVIKKAFGKWSLIGVSDRRVSGQIQENLAGQLLYQQRKKFIETQPGKIYLESNSGYYGLIDIVPNVFEIQRVAFIIRDGRDWVTSWMNWGLIYKKNLFRRTLGHTWLTAKDFLGDPYNDRWDKMSRFERLSWAWNKLNRFALKSVFRNPDAKVFKFKEIFAHKHRQEYLLEMLSFLLGHPELRIEKIRSTHGWLERRIHKSSGDFPNWSEWSKEQRKQFDAICGSLMEDLGYY